MTIIRTTTKKNILFFSSSSNNSKTNFFQLINKKRGVQLINKEVYQRKKREIKNPEIEVSQVNN